MDSLFHQITVFAQLVEEPKPMQRYTVETYHVYAHITEVEITPTGDPEADRDIAINTAEGDLKDPSRGKIVSGPRTIDEGMIAPVGKGKHMRYVPIVSPK